MSYDLKIARFNSPEEYVSYLEAIPRSLGYIRDQRDDFLGMSFNSAVHTLKTGTTKYIKDAQAIVNKMADEQIFSMSVPTLERSIVGCVPNVPAALSGQPYDMLNIVYSEEQSIVSPISIYVDAIVSAGLSDWEIVQRGTAIMSLALALNNIRPVELYVLGLSGCKEVGGAVCQIPTKPLDIERAAFMLCHVAYARRISFVAAQHQLNGNDYHHWAFNGTPTSKEYELDTREALGLEPHDIFLCGGYLLDTIMLTDPVQWVKNMLAKHRGDTLEN